NNPMARFATRLDELTAHLPERFKRTAMRRYQKHLMPEVRAAVERDGDIDTTIARLSEEVERDRPKPPSTEQSAPTEVTAPATPEKPTEQPPEEAEEAKDADVVAQPEPAPAARK